MTGPLTPGPDHPITLAAAPGRMVAEYENHAIASSDRAILLKEASYPEVVYFPREDVSMDYMGRTDRRTHCPYKGDASYFTLTMDGHIAENAAWSYETPYEAMTGIAGMIAFYPNVVTVRAAPGEASSRTRVDEIVQHTDAGAGAAQREPWPANVTEPRG
ncbi:MAG: DUF427 domain-containing protein [Caulobacteraceae bacterium]|nr:DUF427 domain-containing protein [Caulobacteraceae bacterium]